MQDSERIEFTDWGPSVFRMDSIETAPKSKWPLSMITWMLITAGVCLCLCIPFLRALNVLNRHCNVRQVFGIQSPLCPPVNKNSTASPVEDQDDPPAISMEDYWRSMDEIKQEAKHEVEEEIKEREMNYIGDVVKRIRESAAVKAAEAHCLERELMEENQ